MADQANVRFRQAGNTAAYLASRNPRPMEREIVVEEDTGKFKIGDGIRRYNDLDYYLTEEATRLVIQQELLDAGSSATLLAHIYAAEPHPVYDDGPSLELLYENAKV